ncbi:MAG: PAS domain S-box protein [Thermoflexales bacterium]|nr:PAS domain S-box protein [Thermoflexales bacterium]
MLNRMRSWLAPPVFPDEAKTQVAAWLNAILLISLLLESVGVVIVVAFGGGVAGMLIILGGAACHILLLLSLRWGYMRAASIALVVELWASVTMAGYTSSGVDSGVISAYFLILPVAALLLGEVSVIVLAGLSVLALWGLFYTVPTPPALFGKTATISLMLGAAAMVLRFTVWWLNQAIAQARRDKQTLAASNRELEIEISERRRAEEALRRERDLVARVMETSPAGITVVNRHGQIVFANTRAEKVLGLEKDEITTLTFNAPAWHITDYDGGLFPDEDLPFRRVQATGQPVYDVAHAIEWPDGRRVLISINAAPLFDEAGQVDGMVSTVEDVTERKRAEAALQEHARQLQARNEELDAFAHTVAHDLKSPLGLVVGFAEALAETCVSLPPEELRHHLHTIARSGRKIDALIEALLLLASVRQREDVKLGALDMTAIVNETMERLARLVEGCQAQLVVPTSFPVAQGYGPWVEEVWVNYVTNAIKYGGQPPRLELGYSQSQIANRKSQIVFWVRDNGPGLTQEEQERLFRPFERLGQMQAKGYGLGLSIARRIVEKLGGQVGVESQPGQGSLFWFSLPAACVEQEGDVMALNERCHQSPVSV